MIENYNESKSLFEGDFPEIKKYIGVGSINVLAVNPDNETLRKYGWNIPDTADEPKYIFEKERNGKPSRSVKVRILVQITDLEDKPIVPLDFWIGEEVRQSADGKKAQIIDSFGRTAWGDIQTEIKAHKIPQYQSGPASISSDYGLCHRGEEELVRFVFKYMNITPLQRFDRVTNGYVDTTNPGKFKFDSWKTLCTGDMTELRNYFNLRPDNRVKVVFGVSSTEDNRTYQTFLNTNYFGNASMPDKNTGVYTSAQKAIDRYMERRSNSNEVFSAAPVHVWSVSATQKVEDNSDSMFDDEGNFIDNDLPIE